MDNIKLYGQLDEERRNELINCISGCLGIKNINKFIEFLDPLLVGIERNDNLKGIYTMIPIEEYVLKGPPLAKGSFGKIYLSGDYIVKIPIIEDEEDDKYYDGDNEIIQNSLEEYITNVILRCLCNCINQLKCPFPIIRKIRRTSNGVLICFMERLDGTIKDLIKDEPVLKVIELIIRVARIILSLQNDINFTHRDLHGDNIMYKMVSNYPELYVIDFGKTCATLNLKNNYYIDPDEDDRLINCGNRSLDMQIFLASVCANLTDTQTELKYILAPYFDTIEYKTGIKRMLKSIYTPVIYKTTYKDWTW